jgi:hypothetical protein
MKFSEKTHISTPIFTIIQCHHHRQQKQERQKRKLDFLLSLDMNRQTWDIVHVDSPAIWGQPSSQLGLFSSEVPHRDHLVKRFTVLFSDEFQTKWMNILGELFNKDPASFSGTLPTWDEMHQFILKLGVTALGSQTQPSLTAFQLTNNLAFAGICSPPRMEDITAWVWKMKSAGANRGLQELGFNTLSLQKTHLAFNCVYQHFDDNLSEQDRSLMGFNNGFGVIFVEHILCKVVRWNRRLVSNCGKKASLVQLGDEAVQKEIQWVKGANSDDASLFPIPLTMSTSRLTELLVNSKLSFLYFLLILISSLCILSFIVINSKYVNFLFIWLYCNVLTAFVCEVFAAHNMSNIFT